MKPISAKYFTFLFIILSTSCYAQMVTMALPHEPQLIKNSNGEWIVYDIHLCSEKNFHPIKSIISADDNQIFNGSAFQKFSKDSTAFVQYIWIKKGKKQIKELNHQFYYSEGKIAKMISKKILLQLHRPIKIDWPIESGKWIAANAPDIASEHTNTTVKVGNKQYDSIQKAWVLGHNNQRFAIDFVRLNDDGKLFTNDGTSNTDWFSYGTTVKSVADGIVLKVTDSIEDNKTPGIIDYKITKNNIGGNSVFVDIGNGNIAFYGHMQKNSIKVKIGDHIKKGQPLGLLGNSGQTTAPHLHFHIVTSNNIPIDQSINGFMYEGVPYSFESFKSYGKAKEDFWSESPKGKQIIIPFQFKKTTKISKAIPVNFEVIEIN